MGISAKRRQCLKLQQDKKRIEVKSLRLGKLGRRRAAPLQLHVSVLEKIRKEATTPGFHIVGVAPIDGGVEGWVEAGGFGVVVFFSLR